MRFLLKLVMATLPLTLLAGTAAAQTEPADKEQTEPADKELAKVRSELAATKEALTEARRTLEKSKRDQAASQAKLAEMTRTGETLRKELESEKAEHRKAVALLNAAQKALAETKQALTENQTELAQAAKAREILGKEVAEEKARAMAAAARLDLEAKEAARAKAELLADQKTLRDEEQAKAAKDLAASQQKLAETRAAADEVRKRLEAEIKSSGARLETAKRETASIRVESKGVADKLLLTTEEAARTKAELSAAQKILALQPPVPATVVVTLPADAELTFDDVPTTSTGDRRLFFSPPLSLGSTYCYVLTAKVMREGKVVTLQKQIELRAGDRIEVSLTVPASEIIAAP